MVDGNYTYSGKAYVLDKYSAALANIRAMLNFRKAALFAVINAADGTPENFLRPSGYYYNKQN